MELLWPLASFAFVTSITPGPNNIMLTSSGIWFGFLRSVPHMLGISCGFALLLAICAAGIGTLVMALPVVHVLLKAAGSAYLIYLAWKLSRMRMRHDEQLAAKPMSFTAAALFQFANPKAWIMGITGAAAFLPAMQPTWLAVVVYCLVFSLVGLPCISLWAATGAALRRFLTQPFWGQLFSAVMVLLTLYSALAIWH